MVDEAALQRKIVLQEKLIEMLEQRISSTETLSKRRSLEEEDKDEEIQRLEEELERERKRPVRKSSPSSRRSRRIDLSELSAAEILCLAEQDGIPWGR